MKNYTVLAFLLSFLAFSCSYNPEEPDLTQEDTFLIEENEDMAQDEELEDDFEVVNEEEAEDLNQEMEGVIEVQDRVFYGYDSAILSNEAKTTLDTQINWLKNNPNVNITIEGHCDERGTREYNIALGERRAFSAKNYLVKNGVDSARINTVSYGKERPAFLGNSREIHAKNRRAVVVER